MQMAFRRTGFLQPAAMIDLLRLATPVAASRLSLPLMSITDMVVLGRNSPLEIPYITTGYLMFSVGFALGAGILQGVQVLTAELSGSGRGHETGRVLRRGLWIGGLIGLVFTLLTLAFARPLIGAIGFEGAALDGMVSAAHILALGLVWQLISTGAGTYLEALRKPNLVVAIMWAAVFLNLILDLALVAGVWGMEPMGADGVAWASTGVRAFQAVLLVGLVLVLTPGFSRSPDAPKGEFKRQNTVGLGGAMSQVAEFTAFNLTFIIAARASLADGAVYSVALQPTFFSFMLFLGIGIAGAIRVAEAFGRKDMIGVRDASRLSVATFFVISLLVSAGVFIFREPLSYGMMTETGGADLMPSLIAAITISTLAITFDGLQAVASQALRAQEVVWSSTAIQIGAYVVFMIPAAYYLGIVQGQGATGVMWGVVIGSFVAGASQFALLEWKTARWLKQHAV